MGEPGDLAEEGALPGQEPVCPGHESFLFIY